MQIYLREELLEGTRDELILKLRGKKLTYRQIAEKVGCSPTTVGNVLNVNGLTGRLLYDELMQPETFTESDDAKIAKGLGITVSRVSRARKVWLGATEESGTVSLSARRAFLSQFLFKRNPGPKFGDWLTERLAPGAFPYLLSTKQVGLVYDFYVLGTGDNDNYTRYFRFYARQMMFKRLKAWTSVDDLVEKGVLT